MASKTALSPPPALPEFANIILPGRGRAWCGLERACVVGVGVGMGALLGAARSTFCEVVLIDSHSFRGWCSRGGRRPWQRADTLGNYYCRTKPRPVRRCPGAPPSVERPVIGRQQLAYRRSNRRPRRRLVRPIAWPITMMDDERRVTDLKDSSNCFTSPTPGRFFPHTSRYTRRD